MFAPTGTSGAAHTALPLHTPLTSVVGMQQSTLDSIQALSTVDTLNDAARSPCPDDSTIGTWQESLLVAYTFYTEGACLNQNCHLWRRAGYGTKGCIP